MNGLVVAALWLYPCNIMSCLCAFRQEDEAQRPEEGPQQVTGAPQVLAEIL